MSENKKSGEKPAGQKARSVRNYILQPLLQVKLGLYSIVLSLIFALAMGVVLYLNLAKFSEVILQLTGVEDEVKDLLNQYLRPAMIEIAGLMILYVALTMIVAVMFTHKLIGPTIAFRRHIRMIAEGKFQYRTKLRKGDAFQEVASDLNKLSEFFERKNKPS